MKQLEKPVFTYDAACQLCRNRMIDVCVEDCSQVGDYHWFELRRIDFLDLPTFPPPEEFIKMKPKGRGILVAAYLGIMTDFLQGKVEDDLPRFVNRKNGRRVLDRFPLPALFDGAAEEDSPHPHLGAEDSNQVDGPDGVDRKEKGG